MRIVRIYQAFHKNIFLNVGSLHERKKNVELITAFKIWREQSRNTEIKLVLIGDGPEMEHLQRNIHKMNLVEL